MIYPEFKPIELSDQPLFEEAFKKYPPLISEFSFPALYAWRKACQFEVSSVESGLIIKTEMMGKTYLLVPVADTGESVRLTSVLLRELRLPFTAVPEKIAGLFAKNSGVSVKEDAGNADYLYKMQDLVSLSGRRYDGKRNLIKKFRSNYRYEYLNITRGIIRECLDFEDEWCAYKDCDHVKDLNYEREALRVMLQCYDQFNLTGAAFRVGGVIRAIVMAERLNPDTMVVHVLKADQNMPGLYQTALNEFLTREQADYKFVNLEQDLGIDGLRKAKMSYHPVEMIRKYTFSVL